MRTIIIQKLWVTEETIEVEDDATIDEIVNKVDDRALSSPVWDGTILQENDEEIWSC